jgi:hypothetical protein
MRWNAFAARRHFGCMKVAWDIKISRKTGKGTIPASHAITAYGWKRSLICLRNKKEEKQKDTRISS